MGPRTGTSRSVFTASKAKVASLLPRPFKGDPQDHIALFDRTRPARGAWLSCVPPADAIFSVLSCEKDVGSRSSFPGAWRLAPEPPVVPFGSLGLGPISTIEASNLATETLPCEGRGWRSCWDGSSALRDRTRSPRIPGV